MTMDDLGTPGGAGAAPPVTTVSGSIRWDIQVDVLVVGSGAGGMVAGVSAAEAGADVLVLEKAAQIGGTTLRSGGGCWVLNNRFLREMGIEDPRDAALRYMARTAHPHLYSADDPHLGLSALDYDLLEAFYDHGAEVFETLEAIDAFHGFHLAGMADTYAQVPEDALLARGAIVPRAPSGEPAEGPEMLRQLHTALRRRGGDVALEHRVVSVCADDGGAVVGVVAQTPTGTLTIRARRGVIFATGGFTHNRELREAYLCGPVFGGGAAPENEGDFLPMAQSLGAALGTMGHAWLSPIILEQAARNDPELRPCFLAVGDSMLYVNRYGHRAFDEKGPYNEKGYAMMAWNGQRSEYTNLLMLPVWDQRTMGRFAGSGWDGDVIPGPDTDRSHVLQADTLDELAEVLRERVDSLRAHTGGVRLAADFAEQLSRTVERFNGFARAGRDDDFHRGTTAYDVYFHEMLTAWSEAQGRAAPEEALAPESEGWAAPANRTAAYKSELLEDEGEPRDMSAAPWESRAWLNSPDRHTWLAERPNTTMFPLAEQGPYYATILVPGTLDTKGGPLANRHGQVLDHAHRPIPGLYAVGNCAASPQGRAYWASGSTLGPIVTFGWLAGQHASRRRATDSEARHTDLARATS